MIRKVLAASALVLMVAEKGVRRSLHVHQVYLSVTQMKCPITVMAGRLIFLLLCAVIVRAT
jgi:hypothetical protein